MKSPKKYTIEFKREAIKLVTEHGYTQSEAGKNLGVDPKNISRWIRKSSNDKNQPAELTNEAEELKRLRKENQRLLLELEILKKAAAFFAKESN